MMNPSPAAAPASATPPRVRTARQAVIVAIVLLGIATIWQVLSAGAAVFVNPEWWALHLVAVHWFDWLAPAILVLAYVGRLSRAFKLWSAAGVALIFCQYVTAGVRTSMILAPLAALHPLTGFLLLWTLTELLRHGVRERYN